MAIHAYSTLAPARRPLRAAGPCAVHSTTDVVALTADAHAMPLPFVFRPSPPIDDPRSADEQLEDIRRTIEGHISDAR